jgi:hypothetical protein
VGEPGVGGEHGAEQVLLRRQAHGERLVAEAAQAGPGLGADEGFEPADEAPIRECGGDGLFRRPRTCGTARFIGRV